MRDDGNDHNDYDLMVDKMVLLVATMIINLHEHKHDDDYDD